MYSLLALGVLFLSSLSILSEQVATLGVPPAPTSPKLDIVGLDYASTPTTLFGRGTTVYVRLTDFAQNRLMEPDVVRGVIVKSLPVTGTTPIDAWGAAPNAAANKLDLLETGPSTGVFTGSFRVDTGASPLPTGYVEQPPQLNHPNFGRVFGDGGLKVVNGGKVRVEFGALNDEVTWREPSDGVLAVRSQEQGPAEELVAGSIIEGFGATLVFKVTDADLNQDKGAGSPSPAPEVYPGTNAATHPFVLRVFSDSDITGEVVRLVEGNAATNPPTPNNNQATFFGSIGFEPESAIPGNDQVFVKQGDRVRAVYQEAADSTGTAQSRTKPVLAGGIDYWVFRSTTDGTLTLGLPQYFGADSNADGVYEPPLVLTVSDLDQGSADGAPDVVQAQIIAKAPAQAPPTNAEYKDVNLHEVGGLSGLFASDVMLVKPEPDGPTTAALDAMFGPNWIRVNHGDKIYAKYDDLTNAGGDPVTRTQTSEFFARQTAVIQMGTSPAQTIMVGAGLQSIEVFDVDANRNPSTAETISVKIRSSGDSTGINVNLLEDGGNTGHFLGAFRFGTTTSDATDVLRAADRDLVVAEYNDSSRDDGTPGRVLSSNRITWRAATSAQVIWDAQDYLKQNANPAAVVDYATRPNLIIIDQDQNNPLIQDQVPVQITRAIIDVAPVNGLFTREPIPGEPVNAQTIAETTDSFSIRLNRPPTSSVSVGLSSTDTTEGCITAPSPSTACGPVTITFTPANWNVPQTITVRAQDDFLNDGMQLYRIVTAPATSTDPLFSGLNAPDVTIRNMDPDNFGFRLSTNRRLMVGETGEVDQFDVRLTVAPTSAVFVPVSVGEDANDEFDEICLFETQVGTGDPAPNGDCGFATLTFTPTDWDAPHIVRLRGVPDEAGPVPDGHMALTLDLGVAASNDPGFNGLDPPNVAIINFDADRATAVIDQAFVDVSEYGADHANFIRVRLTQPPGSDVDVTLTINRPGSTANQRGRDPEARFVETDGTTQTIRFTPTNWNQPQEVEIVGDDDDAAEGDEDNDEDADPQVHTITSQLLAVAGAGVPDLAFNGPGPSSQVRNWDNEGFHGIPTIVVGQLASTIPVSGTRYLTERDGATLLDVSLSEVPPEGITAPLTVTFTTDNPTESCIRSATDPLEPCGTSRSFVFAPDATSRTQRSFLVVEAKQTAAAGPVPFTVTATFASTDPKLEGTPANVQHFVNFHERPYPAPGEQLFAKEIGTDSGIFFLSLPTGYGGPDHLGIPRFDPGPNGATFVAEVIDPHTPEGASRTITSNRANWLEGPEISVMRFESLSGERLSQIYLPAVGQTRHDQTILAVMYGTGFSTTQWVGSTTCSGKGTAVGNTIVRPTAERGSFARDEGTFRFTRQLTITRLARDATNSVCDEDPTCCDRILTAVPGDAIRFLDLPTAEVLSVRTLVPETMTISGPGGGAANPDNFGLLRSTQVRIKDGPWNQDANGRDVAIMDFIQDNPVVGAAPPAGAARFGPIAGLENSD